MELIYKIVRRLFRDDDVTFSRNRNFDAYEDRSVQRAMRIYRHLRSVEDELLAAVDTGAHLELLTTRDAGTQHERVMVQLRFDERGARRTSYLTGEEWILLLENERVSAILRELAADASDEVQAELASAQLHHPSPSSP